LRDTGLFFPVDPGANASIGGMTSTRASGTTTVRYGGMSANVLALEVVTPQGEVVRFGSRARKTSAGYDLVHLMTGAEGTLGIVTAITVRLHPRPEAVGTLTCTYDAMRPAVDTVIALVQLGAPLARMEFIDEVAARACNAWSGTALPEAPTLFIEFHGTQTAVEEQLERAREVANDHGASSISTTTDEQEIARLWKARHMAYHAGRALRPGTDAVTADIAVPVSRLADHVVAAREDLDAHGLTAVIVGHVGDGNFHVLFLHEPGDSPERRRVDEVYARMIERAQADGGTCTGEHGIGLGKRDKLAAEFPSGTLDLMRAIKRAWDPFDLMNPGKILPDA
jgi:D-lactate dehydrogenase (cytochrome)